MRRRVLPQHLHLPLLLDQLRPLLLKLLLDLHLPLLLLKLHLPLLLLKLLLELNLPLLLLKLLLDLHLPLLLLKLLLGLQLPLLLFKLLRPQYLLVPGWDAQERGCFAGRLRLPLRGRGGARQGHRGGRPGQGGGLSRLPRQQSLPWLNRARLLKLSGRRLGWTSRLQRQRLCARVTRKHVPGWDARERECFAGRLRLPLRGRGGARQGRRGGRLGQGDGLSRLSRRRSLP